MVKIRITGNNLELQVIENKLKKHRVDTGRFKTVSKQ